LQRFELAKAGMNQLINAVGAGVQPHLLVKFFWSRIGWIWAKIEKIKANFGQV